MFNQPKRFRGGKAFCERVTLPPGESPEARFAAWQAAQAAALSCCCHHPRTRLVLTGGNFSPIIRHGEDVCRLHDLPREPVPGQFEFNATAHCPSCRAAHALCPPEFHELPLAEFNTATPERAEALARCREFVAQVNGKGCGWLALLGIPGTGKTRLACGIVRELESREALYVRQGELTLALRATYGRKQLIYDEDGHCEGEAPGPLEVTQKAPFLIVDELGCTGLANDERLLLDELFKSRYDERRPTVLISNLPQNGLKEFLGDALTDRIRHATGNGKFILQFSCESFRRTSGGDYLSGLP